MESCKYLEEIYENGLKSQKGKDFQLLSKLTKRKMQIKIERNCYFSPLRLEISKSVTISFTRRKQFLYLKSWGQIYFRIQNLFFFF